MGEIQSYVGIITMEDTSDFCTMIFNKLGCDQRAENAQNP